MEPVDYLKILKNHWKAVAALVVVAVGLAYVFTPAEATRNYTAEHVLALETEVVAEGALGPSSVIWTASRISLGDMPTRAAELMDYTGDLEDLTGMVTGTPDADIGTVTITATASDHNQAVQVANAFGVAWIDLVEEEYGANSAEMTEEEMITRLAQIDTVLERAEPPDNAEELRVERLELEQALSGEDETGGPVRYVTLEEASSAESDTAMFASRNERMALFGVLAAIIGFGVAVLLDRNDSRLRNKQQAEKEFGLPVLAEVPLLSLRERNRAAVVAYEREPRMAEAYRSLRTALLLVRGDSGRGGHAEHDMHNRNGHGSPGFGHPGSASAAGPHSGGGHGGGADNQASPRQVVVVTSAEPGEGKSTSSANLAMAYAEAGHSVLILNWDLWRPISPAVFGAADGPGISDYLEDEGPALIHYVQDTAVPGVRIVTAGTQSGQPSPRSQSVHRLLEQARGLASVVVVDTAPILSASVTRELATLADAVVIVGRVGRTTAEAAGRCAELFERIGAPALGVVLIGVPTGAFSDYYGPARKAGYDRVAVAGPRRKPAAGTQALPSGPSSPRTDDADRSSSSQSGRHMRSSGSSGGFRAATPERRDWSR